MYVRSLSIGTVLCAFGVATPLAQAIVIDDFDVSSVNLTVDAAAPMQTFRENVATVLGGQRDGYIQFVATTIPGNEARLRIDRGNSGVLSHSQDGGVRARSVIIWDGSADVSSPDIVDPTGLGSVDLLADNSLAFQFQIVAADVNGVLRMFVYTDANNWSVNNFSFPGNLSQQPVTLHFADFVTGVGASGPADFTNVGAIALIIDGSTLASLDVSIDLLDTVTGIPEPMTAGLSILALGALGGVLARRKR